MTDASAQSCQPGGAEPTPQELAAWADEIQTYIDEDVVPGSDMRKATVTAAVLRSHASLKDRIEVLVSALREIRDLCGHCQIGDEFAVCVDGIARAALATEPK